MAKSNILKSVQLFCDGACSGNPGPGGWGAILRFNGIEKELSGGEALTTNNRMELLGCISGLEALKEPCEVLIFTDSKYLADAFGKKWIAKWMENGWITSGKKPVKNRELWERLIKLSQQHRITWNWIKGHAGHPENERCDKIAVIERNRFAKAL